MLETSFIYIILTRFIDKYKLYYSSSKLNVIFSVFFAWCMKIWNGSLINKMLFNTFGFEHKYNDSLIGRSLNRILSKVDSFSKRSSKILKGSNLLKYSNYIFNYLFFGSCRSYGIIFITTGLFSLLYTAFDERSFVFIVTSLGIAFVGLLFIFINRPLVSLFNGSLLLKLISGFFGIDSINENRLYTINPRFYGLFALIGIGLSFVFMEFSVIGFVFVFAAVIGVFLVFYKTEIGVLTTIFLIPLLPTMPILVLTLLTVVSFLANSFISGNVKIKFSLIDLFVSMFGLLLLYSVSISYFKSSSLVVALTYILFILFYFTVKNTINTKEKLLGVVSLIVVAGGLISLYGIYQFITGDYIRTDAWLDTEMFTTTSSRIYSTLDNPNVLGEYLLFIIPLSFSMVYYFKDYFYKFIGLSIVGVSGICMIMTYSRGAWLGLILAFGVFALLKDRRLLWLALLALLMLPFILPQSIIERFTSIGNMSDGSTSYRVNIWLASILMIKAFWPIGIGLGTQSFVYIYRKYAFNAINAPHSHNLFLQIFIDLGIVGIILFLAIVLIYFKTFFVRIIKTKDSFFTAVGAALCAGMCGYLLQGMTDNVWYNYRIVLFFWSIIGLCGCYIEGKNIIKNEVCE